MDPAPSMAQRSVPSFRTDTSGPPAPTFEFGHPGEAPDALLQAKLRRWPSENVRSTEGHGMRMTRKIPRGCAAAPVRLRSPSDAPQPGLRMRSGCTSCAPAWRSRRRRQRQCCPPASGAAWTAPLAPDGARTRHRQDGHMDGAAGNQMPARGIFEKSRTQKRQKTSVSMRIGGFYCAAGDIQRSSSASQITISAL